MTISNHYRTLGPLAVISALLLVETSLAEVRLPEVFSSAMVLQQQKPITLWGWANPGETVTIELAGKKQLATANTHGEWRTSLPAMTAGGPFTLNVAASNQIKLDDILIGEVWLCSGQSNMEMGVGMALNAKEEIAAANYPKIRLLSIPRVVANVPQPHTNASWKVCSPETIAEAGWGGFSATAYYFGRALHQSLKVPVGLINSSWGGTRIEPWTPPEGFATEPALKSIYDGSQLADPRTPQHQQRLADYLTSIDAWSAAARSAMTKQELVPTMPAYPKELANLTESKPVSLYNGMINPLVPMTMRGCIWYQGEANHTEGMLYVDKTRALVNGWRKTFQQDDLAYYYVQIAPYQYGDEDATILAKFWEAQAAAMTIPNTGMVVTTDIGNVTDIHPTNKQEVGRRLALWALAKTYHKTGTVFSGPVFKSMETSGKQLRLTFDHVGGGLVSRDGKPLNWFEIIDGDTGAAVPATATIDGNTVVLTAATVNKPVGMRFAWSKLAEPNLSNKDGLPALPFRAGKNPT